MILDSGNKLFLFYILFYILKAQHNAQEIFTDE